VRLRSGLAGPPPSCRSAAGHAAVLIALDGAENRAYYARGGGDFLRLCSRSSPIAVLSWCPPRSRSLRGRLRRSPLPSNPPGVVDQRHLSHVDGHRRRPQPGSCSPGSGDAMPEGPRSPLAAARARARTGSGGSARTNTTELATPVCPIYSPAHSADCLRQAGVAPPVDLARPAQARSTDRSAGLAPLLEPFPLHAARARSRPPTGSGFTRRRAIRCCCEGEGSMPPRTAIGHRRRVDRARFAVESGRDRRC